MSNSLMGRLEEREVVEVGIKQIVVVRDKRGHVTWAQMRWTDKFNMIT